MDLWITYLVFSVSFMYYRMVYDLGICSLFLEIISLFTYFDEHEYYFTFRNEIVLLEKENQTNFEYDKKSNLELTVFAMAYQRRTLDGDGFVVAEIYPLFAQKI